MKNIDWDKIISDFKNYEGTISNFCKENDISKQQFYYNRGSVHGRQSKKPYFLK